jgi:hypothetical protein
MKIMFCSIVTLLATSMFAMAQSQPTATTVPEATVQAPSQTVTVTTLAPPTTNVAPQAAPAPTAPVAAPAPELVKQPTTVVEATPLTTSHADDLRKSREQTEVETEQKIVEKLEQSRINDEKKRQDKVLNSMSDDKKEDVVVVPAPAPAPAVVAAPAPAPLPAPVVMQAAPPVAPAPPPAFSPNQELTAQASDVAPEIKPENRYFTSLGIGMMNYNGSPDLKNYGDFGLSFGKVMDNIVLSADFGYNSMNQNLTPDGAVYRSVNQYTLGMTGRYMLPFGKFRPSVGGTLDYVRRSYSGLDVTDGVQSYNSSQGSVGSNAIDYGFVGALDYLVTDHMSVGVEYRYMMNLTYSYDNQTTANIVNDEFGESPLESRNYQTLTFALRYMY